MNYKVASSISEVLNAWCVVYRQYLAASLIAPNEFSVFTFPEYLSNNTAVITGEKMGHTVCTVSGVLDSGRGLPLDHYYRNELNTMRAEGRKLIEIGLLADARGVNNFSNIVELMSGIAKFGVYSDHHDFVIGVNPRRVNFFHQTFGFNPVGEIKDYGRLKTAPVILLHACGKDMTTASREVNRRIYDSETEYDFANRFKFNPENYISAKEFTSSVEHFIKSIWKPEPALLPA